MRTYLSAWRVIIALALLFSLAANPALAQAGHNQPGVRHYELGAYLSQYDICGIEEPVGMVNWKPVKDADGAKYLDTIAVNLDYLGVPWDGRPQWYEETIVNYATWLRDHTQGNVLLHTRPMQRLDWMPAPGQSPYNPRIEFYPTRTCSIPPDAAQRYAEYISWVAGVFSEKLGSRLKYFVHGAEAQSQWEGKIDEFERSGQQECLEGDGDYDAMLNAAYDAVKKVDSRIYAFPSFAVEELYALSFEPSRNRWRGCLEGADRNQCAAANIARAASLKRDKFGVAFQPFSHAHSSYDPSKPNFDARFLYDNALEVFFGIDWLGAGAKASEGIVVTETSWNATEVTVQVGSDPNSGGECWDYDFDPQSEPQFTEIDFYTNGSCVAASWPYQDPEEPMGSPQEQSDFFNNLIIRAHENPHVELITWWSVRDQIDTGVVTNKSIAPVLTDNSCNPVAWDNTIHAFRYTIAKDAHDKYGTPYSSDLAYFGEASLKNWSTTGFLDYFGNDVGRPLKSDWSNVRANVLFNEGTDRAQCFDALDNDGDGLYNCDDPNCQNEPYCMLLNYSKSVPDWATLSSPDGHLTMTIKQMDLGVLVPRYPSGALLYYQLQRDGETVLDWSSLGLYLADSDFTFNLQPVAITSDMVGDAYTLVHGKRSQQSYAAGQLVLAVQNPAGELMALRFRLFDDGLAFRYELPGSSESTVTGEQSAFRLPEGATGYLAEAAQPSQYQPGYEGPYYFHTAGSEPSAGIDGYYYPALFRLPGGDTHMLLHEAGLDSSYAGTRLDADTRDRVYQIRLPSPDEGDPLTPAQPTVTRPVATPWRLAMVGTLGDIVASNLTTHLSPALDPVFQGDTSWIKPGKAAWSWWSQDTQTPALQREYIDSAAEFGWEYVIVDAEWSRWPDAATAVPALVQYANERGVRILLWYNSGGANNDIAFGPRDRFNDEAGIQAEFAQLAAWGVAGVKVDFFRSDKQPQIKQYHDILRIAAEHDLHVVLHGSTPPRGWRRQFPNLLTSEAVFGAEHYKWSQGPDAEHNVRLVFTRNVVGAMDYTPLTFAEPLALQGISYAHQIALAVVFESALQVFSDQADLSPDQGFRQLFAEFPFLKGFLQRLPVSWDDTRLVEGDPASHAVLARRQGNNWYVAGINGQAEPRDVVLDMAELLAGEDTEGLQYIVTIMDEGATPDQLQNSVRIVPPDGQVEVTLEARGGFVLIINPVPAAAGCGA
jgi:alpha-glucosidase